MARLPIPGSDEGEWGEILNEYLLQAHAINGAIKPGVVTLANLAPSVQTQITASVGATGPVGPSGPSGATGATGASGVAGPSGPQGPTGSQGDTGATGAIGATGASGPAGATGAVGPAGVVVLNPGDPDPDPPLDGVLYIRLTGETIPTPDPEDPGDEGDDELLFSDNFNRANGAVGNGWLDYADGTANISIVSNALQVTGYEADGYRRGVSKASLPRGVSVRAVFTNTIDWYQGIFLAHSATTNTGVKLFNNGGTWVIGNSYGYADNNTPVSFTNSPLTPYTSLRLDFNGTTITAYINDVVVHTMLAASLGFSLDTNSGDIYRAGYCGETTSTGSHARIDSFEVYRAS